MMQVYWDDVELPFSDTPSTALPRADTIDGLAAAGEELHWVYKGLVGVLTPEILRQEYDTFIALQQQRHRREPVPKRVGKFVWSQTVPLAEADRLRQLRQSCPADQTTAGDKPRNLPA